MCFCFCFCSCCLQTDISDAAFLAFDRLVSTHSFATLIRTHALHTLPLADIRPAMLMALKHNFCGIFVKLCSPTVLSLDEPIPELSGATPLFYSCASLPFPCRRLGLGFLCVCVCVCVCVSVCVGGGGGDKLLL